MNVPFWTPRGQKTARFGPSSGKTESRAASPPEFWSFHPLELFGLIHKRPGHDPFFAENQFSPADEFVFMGVVVRSCHFDVTACAEAGRLAQRPERSLRDLSARSRMNSQSNQKFTAQSNICSQMEYIALLIYIVSVSSFGATVCSVN